MNRSASIPRYHPSTQLESCGTAGCWIRRQTFQFVTTWCVVGVLPGFGSTPTTHQVVTNWNVWRLIQQPAVPHDSSWVLGWYLGIDALLFIPVYSCLFLILLVRARKHLLDKSYGQPEGDNAVY